jgi:hypothetical protein
MVSNKLNADRVLTSDHSLSSAQMQFGISAELQPGMLDSSPLKLERVARTQKRFFAIFNGSMETGTLNCLRDEVCLEIPSRRVLPRRHRDTEE